MCYGDTFTKYNHITLSFIHPQFILHQESFFLAVICAYLQIYEYGHGKHFQGKSLIKFFFLPSSSRCPRRRATLRRKRWKSEERRGGGGEKKTNKDFDNEDDGGEEVEETISSEVA